MSYRKILAPVFGARRDQAALEGAFELAKHFSAHVEVLFVRADPVSVLPLGYIGDISGAAAQYAMEAATKAADAAQKLAEECFAKASDKCGVPVSLAEKAQVRPTAELRIVQGDFPTEIERHSRLCDLIVFGGVSKDIERESIQEGIESALMSGARPVLFLPQEAKALPAQRVAIAYDGSAAAAHAVTSALPFLQGAKELHVFEVTAEKQSQLSELHAYLHLRGLHAVAHKINPGTMSTAQALVRAVQAQGCDLLVLGGYGHSRLREFVFGGVTRHVLHHSSPFAVVLAH